MNIKINYRHLVTAVCALLVSGLAAANCGSCGKEKACSDDSKKACCKKADAKTCGEKKACKEECDKACCKKGDAKTCDKEKAGCKKADGKACEKECKKACHKKDGDKTCDQKKACGKECTKPCCAVVGKQAPDFTLNDTTGKPVQLSKLAGKTVVLEWTNYDCPFVKPHYADEAETMGKLANKYADKDVVWLTINSTNYATAETNKKWVKENNIKQTVLIDSDGSVGKLYKAKTTPHIFIVDKNGKVAYQGAIDNAPQGKVPQGQEYVNYVDKALAELVVGKPVTVSMTKSYGCSVKYAAKSTSG